jgi:hypothetical protein
VCDSLGEEEREEKEALTMTTVKRGQAAMTLAMVSEYQEVISVCNSD